LNKDQTIGATIFAACVTIGVFYLVTLLYSQWLNTLTIQTTNTAIQFWVIAVPVLAAFIAILGIGAWIGWTMATTPPPRPIEEIAGTSETEETKNKGLEKQS